MSNNVTVFDHPLITHKISILRDEQTGSKQFRELIEEIAMLMGFEAMRDLPLKTVQVKTPITTANVKMLEGEKLALVPILWIYHVWVTVEGSSAAELCLFHHL